MINLIPNDLRQNTIYARRNTRMRHWIGIFLVSILGVVIITVLGLFNIRRSIHTYSSQISQTQQELSSQHLEATQKEVQDISNSLKLVVQVLSREVLFSNLIKQVAKAIPNNAVLTDLDISKVQGGIDLSAAAKDYGTATQVLVNLQDPANKIFDKADLVNVSCTKTTDANAISSHYPCTIKIRAQFAKTNPFLFINEKAKP